VTGDANSTMLACCLAQTAQADVSATLGLEAARQAQRLARQLQQACDEGHARLWACTHLARMACHDEVLQLAREVSPLLQGEDRVAERMELLRCVTLSASEVGAFDQALDAAHALVAVCKERSDVDSALSAAFGLAVCLERLGDSWQASRLLQQALQERGEAGDSRPYLIACNGLCAISLGLSHLLRDTGNDAELLETLRVGRQHGERALLVLCSVTDPVYEVVVLGNLGETRMMMGDVEAALPLLQQGLALAQARELRAATWRMQTSMADWHLLQGQSKAALSLMLDLLQQMGAAAPQQIAVRAHESAYRACRNLALHEQALQHLEAAERLKRSRAIAQLRAQSLLFVTRTEAQRDRESAERAQAEALRHQEQAQLHAAEAERDPLTGLGNRRHLDRRCAELLPPLQRLRTPLALAVLDIDHFKRVNDRHGHAVGDRVLTAVAQLLRENSRASDVLARHGGEEFVIVLPGMTCERAAEVCERLRDRIQSQDWTLCGGPSEGITVSIGLACAPLYDQAWLIHAADLALYRAKHAGRNRLMISGAGAESALR